MPTRQVGLEWLEAVRDLLYEIAHQPGAIGQRAEALGQNMPEILATQSRNHDREPATQRMKLRAVMTGWPPGA